MRFAAAEARHRRPRRSGRPLAEALAGVCRQLEMRSSRTISTPRGRRVLVRRGALRPSESGVGARTAAAAPPPIAERLRPRARAGSERTVSPARAHSDRERGDTPATSAPSWSTRDLRHRRRRGRKIPRKAARASRGPTPGHQQIGPAPIGASLSCWSATRVGCARAALRLHEPRRGGVRYDCRLDPRDCRSTRRPRDGRGRRSSAASDGRCAAARSSDVVTGRGHSVRYTLPLQVLAPVRARDSAAVVSMLTRGRSRRRRSALDRRRLWRGATRSQTPSAHPRVPTPKRGNHPERASLDRPAGGRRWVPDHTIVRRSACARHRRGFSTRRASHPGRRLLGRPDRAGEAWRFTVSTAHFDPDQHAACPRPVRLRAAPALCALQVVAGRGAAGRSATSHRGRSGLRGLACRRFRTGSIAIVARSTRPFRSRRRAVSQTGCGRVRSGRAARRGARPLSGADRRARRCDRRCWGCASCLARTSSPRPAQR